VRAQVTNGRTTRRWECGGAGGWPGEWQQLDGYGGGNIHFGGFGAGGAGVGCHVVRNRLIASVCPTIGSYCTHEFCQEAGQPRWAFSCFDSCTHHQCDDLVNLLWQDGVEWASCEWHGDVGWDSPATVAVFAQVACGGRDGRDISSGGSAFQDCLCAGRCLTDCIEYVGGKPCTITVISAELGEECCPQAVYDRGPFYCDYLGLPRKRCANPDKTNWWDVPYAPNCQEFADCFNMPSREFLNRSHPSLCEGENNTGTAFQYCAEEAVRCVPRVIEYCREHHRGYWAQRGCIVRGTGCCDRPWVGSITGFQGHCNAELMDWCSD